MSTAIDVILAAVRADGTPATIFSCTVCRDSYAQAGVGFPPCYYVTTGAVTPEEYPTLCVHDEERAARWRLIYERTPRPEITEVPDERV
jgi:hypothetical protein